MKKILLLLLLPLQLFAQDPERTWTAEAWPANGVSPRKLFEGETLTYGTNSLTDPVAKVVWAFDCAMALKERYDFIGMDTGGISNLLVQVLQEKESERDWLVALKLLLKNLNESAFIDTSYADNPIDVLSPLPYAPPVTFDGYLHTLQVSSQCVGVVTNYPFNVPSIRVASYARRLLTNENEDASIPAIRDGDPDFFDFTPWRARNSDWDKPSTTTVPTNIAAYGWDNYRRLIHGLKVVAASIEPTQAVTTVTSMWTNEWFAMQDVSQDDEDFNNYVALGSSGYWDNSCWNVTYAPGPGGSNEAYWDTCGTWGVATGTVTCGAWSSTEDTCDPAICYWCCCNTYLQNVTAPRDCSLDDPPRSETYNTVSNFACSTGPRAVYYPVNSSKTKGKVETQKETEFNEYGHLMFYGNMSSYSSSRLDSRKDAWNGDYAELHAWYTPGYDGDQEGNGPFCGSDWSYGGTRSGVADSEHLWSRFSEGLHDLKMDFLFTQSPIDYPITVITYFRVDGSDPIVTNVVTINDTIYGFEGGWCWPGDNVQKFVAAGMADPDSTNGNCGFWRDYFDDPRPVISNSVEIVRGGDVVGPYAYLGSFQQRGTPPIVIAGGEEELSFTIDPDAIPLNSEIANISGSFISTTNVAYDKTWVVSTNHVGGRNTQTLQQSWSDSLSVEVGLKTHDINNNFYWYRGVEECYQDCWWGNWYCDTPYQPIYGTRQISFRYP